MARSSDTIVIGFVHPVDVSAYFMMSLLGAALHDITPRGNTRIVGVENEFSSANISTARNAIVQRFLADYEAEWLLFVDADMWFAPDAIEGILRNAHEQERPVVGGLCFGIDKERLFPTLYDLTRTEGGEVRVLRRTSYPDNEVVQVAATGGAFLLIHRRVLEEIRVKEFNQTYPWFQETEIGGNPCSEDFTFCLRAGLLGIPVHVDTAVKIGHHKSMVLTHEMFQAQRGVERGTDGEHDPPVAD